MRRSGNRMGNRGGAMNRGFSNDRSFGSGPSSAASVGPLMTDHLELHDLDLELELLKRKREILEQQQNMLLNDTRFTPQLGNGSQFNQNRNYSNFYNDVVAGTQFDHLDRQPSLKRAAPGVWNDGPAPKHYAGPSRSGQGPRKSGPFPKRNSRFDQKMGSGSGPSHAPGQRRPPPGNFKQNKVTKPNQGQGSAPNRLASYPANKVKGLLGSMVPPVRSAPKRPEEILFLRADEAPSPKLVGRLELALGQLLRELREEFGASRQHAEVFRSTTIQRLIKQNIRERIRDVMLNKQVGPCPEIVTLYRKKFPKHTDLELITNAQNTCEGRNSFVRDLIETANPEKYFKLNFEKLLNETLTNVFAQLEEVNKSKLKHKEARTKAGAEIMESIIVDLEADPDFAKIHVKEDKTDGADVNNTSEITDEKSAQQDNEINEQAANPDETSENGEKSAEVDEKSAEVAEKSADVADNSDIAEKSADIAENSAENAENTSENTDNTENIAKTEENLATESAEQASTETDNQEVKSNPIINKIIDDCFKSKAIVGEPLKAKFFTRLIENMLRRMIPTMLPRYKEQMIRIINSDEEFRKTKAYITMMANRKAENMANPQNGGASLVAEGQPPYFVKILGRPTLPHRKLMKVFLEQFHPTLIKKHKGSHNVLYVAFGDKEDVRNILEKSGDIVANMMLDIRVSEGISKRKSGWGPGPQLNSSNVQTAEPSSDNAGLDESLDNQITDLLTSIREEEEKKCDIAEQQVVKNETVKDENTEEVKNENVDVKQDVANENGEDTKNEAEEENQPPPEQEDNETAPVEDKETAEDEEMTEAVQKEVEAVKTEGTQGKGTPTRASSRLAATPSAIRTRRASKLGQN